MMKTAAVAASLFACTSVAFAQQPPAPVTRKECTPAYTDTQVHRKDGRLRDARAAAIKCSQTVCIFQRKDCVMWLEEIEAAMPTVVFAARDESGRDVATASVEVDDVVVQESLDGKPQEIDPGQHKVVFRSQGFPAVEQSVLIVDAEKGKVVSVTFARPAPEKPKAAAPPPAPPQDATPSLFDNPWPWVVGGAGLATAGVGVAFWVMSIAGQDEISDNCGKTPAGPGYDVPACADLGSANDTKQGLAIGLGGAGALAVGAAATWIILGMRKGAGDELAALRPSVSVGQVKSVGVGGRF